MFDSSKTRYLIEHALEAQPRCAVCGAPTTIDERDGRLWLVCSATTQPIGLRARLAVAIMPHDRAPVADLAEDLAA